MLISKILENVSAKKSYSKDIDINNISDDSRKIGKGDMFVAVCGAVADGHAFVETAIGNGAVAVVVNRSSDVPCLAKYPDIQVITVVRRRASTSWVLRALMAKLPQPHCFTNYSWEWASVQD